MNIGFIGLPNSGKTTIFNALAKSEAQVSSYANSKSEPNRAMLEVADGRVATLSEEAQVSSYANSKSEPNRAMLEVADGRVATLSEAAIELIDFTGLTQGAAREGLFSSSSMGLIKATDALALVAKNFSDGLTGPSTPLQDIEKLEDELLISDLIIAENRLERIEKAGRQGKKTNLLEIEEKILKKIIDHLSSNRAIRDLKLEGESEKMIRGFQFLTQKPIMIIVNSDENNFAKNQDLLQKIEKRYRVIEFAGKFEMELSQLNDQDEIALFLADMGIKESAKDRLCTAAYELLGYISFFTVGSDEVRAWSLRQGESVLAAAGTIHTDLARGFIRAECFSYDDLIAHGSEKQVSEKGLMRLEGRKYVVQDGNVLNIRFNV
jgi:GTP-binding protein YchF